MLTGNVLEEQADPRNLADLINGLDPDLVFLQEMAGGPSRVLADIFKHHHLIPGLECLGRGVASKHDAELGSLDLPWRAGTYARLNVEGLTLTAAGVHMPNPIVFPWWRAVKERRDQVDALLAWADDQHSDGLIVAGDMNASPAWPLYRRLAGHMEDLPSQVATGVGEAPQRTWGWRPGWPRMLRIDHVFGRGVHAVGTSVHPIPGSDHHALVVDLAID